MKKALDRWLTEHHAEEIRDQFHLDVTYFVNFSHNLPYTLSLNQSDPQLIYSYKGLLSQTVPNPFYPLLPKTSLSGTTVGRSQLMRPYPHFTGISADLNQGYSWYHSLQVRAARRVTTALGVNGSPQGFPRTPAHPGRAASGYVFGPLRRHPRGLTRRNRCPGRAR